MLVACAHISTAKFQIAVNVCIFIIFTCRKLYFVMARAKIIHTFFHRFFFRVRRSMVNCNCNEMVKLISLLDVGLWTKIFSVAPHIVRSAKVLRQRVSRNWDILWRKIEIPFRSKWKTRCSWNSLSFVFWSNNNNNPAHHFYLLSVHCHRDIYTNFAKSCQNDYENEYLHVGICTILLALSYCHFGQFSRNPPTVSWIGTNGWTNDDDDEVEKENTGKKMMCVCVCVLFAHCSLQWEFIWNIFSFSSTWQVSLSV